ncbi:hypothetical protein [Candidatus Marimicrobium litorale]|uniref:Uncharacterized protein n=1 Tax=Candidatus Marimicrobium litorale TaxID=2518991 RepID=A0ABT3T271_9GAMM|nr:hypothetical protein [Candidatus Marimicrobium litorale]MCX2976361.1 hypothetical protein [Candidatus Marimicrobium litorale]
MTFQASKHMRELIPLGEYYSKKNDELYAPRFPASRRQFHYQCTEAKDKGFINAQCGVFILGQWFIWPRACTEYIQAQAERTVKRYGTAA